MVVNLHTNYNQFYKGTESLKNYGSGKNKKDTLVKYEFNTTDEHGNKVMDKMSKEETLAAMKEIGSQYGDSVIVEFSGDGLAALVDSKKGVLDNIGSKQDMDTKNADFQKEIVHLDRSANDMPEYSGIYAADKTIATSVENCSKDEKAFVYDIIRKNFLVDNAGSMTEEERQANISLGMKKAEYAAKNFIPQEQRKDFLDAMEDVAKLASAGKADENGNMDYGINKRSYLGQGSNLVYTDDTLDIMKKMDKDAYAQYQKIKADDSRENSTLDALKYMTKWYANAVKENPDMIDEYHKKSNDYMEESVKDRKLDDTFSGLDVENKSAFLDSLSAFQKNNPSFLANIIDSELSYKFWK